MKSYITLLILILLNLSSYSQIQIGKSIIISIGGVPSEEKGRIDGNYRVAENGTINMPFIGQINASGLRPEVLATTLEARYRAAQIYSNPTFQVVSDREGTLVDDAVVHVGGQIGRPGKVEHVRGLTLWQAIQSAGGPTPFGTLKRVQLQRNGKQRQYDLTVLENMQINLEPNDNIEVPQKRPWETK